MRAFIIAVLIFPLSALADLSEYSVKGETRLYDSACYWNMPEKIATAKNGGYNVIVPAMPDDCRVQGTFAKVNIYKYDFVTGSTVLFEGSWISVEQAERHKSKLDAAYKNVLNAGFATQVVKLEVKNF